MTREILKALSGAELKQVSLWVLEETHERTEREKQETIARIKKLAADTGLSVTINGAKGRPKKPKDARKAAAPSSAAS
jgi:hypothetical protein